MADFREGTPEESAFLAELVGAGLFIESGVPGVYGFNGTFVDIRDRMADLVTRNAADDQPEIMRFPPVLPKATLEDTGYMNSFPHLGTFALEGPDDLAIAKQALASTGAAAFEDRPFATLSGGE